MKKAIIIFILASLLLCSCGKSGDPGDKSGTDESASVTESTGGSTKGSESTGPSAAVSSESETQTASATEEFFTTTGGSVITTASAKAQTETSDKSTNGSSSAETDGTTHVLHGYTGTNVAIGSTAALQPGETRNPLDKDGDGWIDYYF